MICELVSIKRITVIEYNKFQRCGSQFEELMRLARNVFNYNEELIAFLDSNNILYSVSE